jgi:mRNA-degrading endonuclease HigB of HigAB toxin-antitoxin module
MKPQAVHYDKQRIYVRHVMTHAEYDQNDWRKK